MLDVHTTAEQRPDPHGEDAQETGLDAIRNRLYDILAEFHCALVTLDASELEDGEALYASAALHGCRDRLEALYHDLNEFSVRHKPAFAS